MTELYLYLPSADVGDAAGLDLFGGESDEGVGAKRAGDLLAKELADRPSGGLHPPGNLKFKLKKILV